MDELYPGIFKILPSRPTEQKYVSFFVQRSNGNLLLPCFSNQSSIHAHFDFIAAHGGITRQLLGDSHFRSSHCDEVAEAFDAPLFCSEVEGPDVRPKLKHVELFPFTRHLLEPGVEVIPTPGHRPGGVCYRVTLERRNYLFAGDAIWHDNEKWRCYPTKQGRNDLVESLRMLAEVDFDVLFANTRVSNPICSIEVDEVTRKQFMDTLIEQM